MLLALTGHGLWRSLVSASVWGTEGREFKSPQPDRRAWRVFEFPCTDTPCAYSMR